MVNKKLFGELIFRLMCFKFFLMVISDMINFVSVI